MAGRARIAVTGIQDQWLSGDPSYSYFVTVFKRHTRFSTETVEIPFTGDFKLGSTLRSIIPNNVGDLVRSMTLKLQLGTLPTHTSTEKYYYNVPTAKSLLKYVDLKIGGQTIERLTGEYITMYDQLHSNKDDVNQTLYFLNGQGNHLTVSGSYDTFYVNLPFYFFRNPSLAIPVCALKKQMIEVELAFKDIDDDVTFKYTLQENGSVTRAVTKDGRILNASVLVDFFFVTEDERNYLLTRPMDYLITQLQVSTIPFKPNETKKSALLKFVNPVKELFFVAKEDTDPNATRTIAPDDPVQLGNDIDGPSTYAYAGRSVSVSSDGSRLAIGFSGDGSNGAGMVRVFDWSGTSWTQVGSDIAGLAYLDGFGYTVSLSSDGARLAIGAPYSDPVPSSSGQVSVYELSGSTWVPMGSTFSGSANNEQLGNSVSLNSDGTKLAFGATELSTGSGYVKVYSWSGTSWTEDAGGFLLQGDSIGDEYGRSVSLSSDGTRLAVGAAASLDPARGYVRVYEFSGNAWGRLGSIINGEGSTDKFGFSVSLSSDGTRFAAGATKNNTNSGHVRVFEYSSDWTQVGSDIDAESSGDNFGSSVSLNSDGTRLAAGAVNNSSNRGHTRVFDWSGTSWNQIAPDIDGEAAGDFSGYSAALSSNGLRLAIGAPYNADGGTVAGHVRVFQLDKEETVEEDSLLDTTSSDQSFSTAIIGTGNQLKRSDHRLIKNVRLDFNGKNIFDYSGTYLAYGQSLKYHTGCPDPAYEFYTYSFALDPEKHYPTGQVNMSRIIHKKLDVELDEVSTTRDIKVRVYALSFNILRIQGGLAGLKF